MGSKFKSQLIFSIDMLSISLDNGERNELVMAGKSHKLIKEEIEKLNSAKEEL